MTPKTSSRGLALRALSIGIAAALAAPMAGAQSLPTGGTAVTSPGGTAPTISTNAGGDTMTVTSGGTRSLINWNTFDVAQGFTFNFNAGSSTDILLNRVIGSSLSTINGTVVSNGNVWLLNPNGIAVGATGVFDVAGLMLSTGAITDADFFGADTTFAISGANGAISVAQGARLSSSSSPGAIALIADAITFGGTANAGTSGQTALVGARGVSVTFDANLDAFTTLTITEGSGTATAVNVGGASAFSGNKTVIAAAGMMDGAGNVLLNNGGGADTVAFNSGDIVLFAAANAGGGTSRNVLAAGGRTQQTGTATAGAASVQINGNVGSATQDLDIRSAGAVDFSTSTLQGRDVAIGSSNSVTIGAATAQDDLVIRSQGITVNGLLTSGASNNAVDTDFSGAADYLQTTTLSGNDMSLYAETGLLTVNTAASVGDGYRIRGSDFAGAGVFTPNFTFGIENTFVITDTAGGFTAGNLSSPGRLWIEVQNGGNLDVTGPLTSTNGDVQLITSGGGNINLGGNVTSGARSGSANEYVSLRSSGAINQTAGIINTTLSTSGSLYASAANGISLGQANQFATAAFQNTGAGGILVRNAGSFTLTTLTPDSFNPTISGATTGSGNIDIEATNGVTVAAVPVSTGTGDIRLAAGNVTLSGGPVTTGGGNIVVDGATALAAGTTTFTATGGTATFNGTIDGQAVDTGDLVVNANGAAFNGNVGATNALASLTVNGATTLNANTVSAANAIDLDDLTVASTLAGNATLTTDGALTLANVTANHAGTLAGTGASVNVASFAGPDASLSLATTGGALSLGSATSGGTVTLTSAGGDIAIGTTVDATGNITVDSVGAVRANALRSSGGAVSVTALGTVGGSAPGTRMDVSAANEVSVDSSGAALLGTVTSTNGGITAVTNGLDVTTANAAGALSLNGGASGITLGTGAGTSTSLNTGGALNVTGILTTNLLTGTAGGGATLNGANQIAELGAFNTSSLSLNNARGLTVSGVVDAGTGDASIAVTGGNLEIASAGQVRGAGVDLSTDANFLNASGSDAVVASGRWVIYSQAPTGNVFDNLDSGNTAFWNATRATLAPGSVDSNRYVFAFQPRLTLTTDSVTKVYGTDLTGNSGVGFTITGYQPGVAGAFLADTEATVFNGTPRVTSDGFAPRASVNGGPYGITVDPDSLATNSGYAVDVTNAGSVTVTPLGITATPDADDKTYDGTTAGTGTLTLNGVLAGDDVGATATFTFTDPNTGVQKQVNVTGLALTGAAAGNYTVTLSGQALADIFARAITVTADPKTKVVGNPDPALTYTITNGSLVTGDSLTGSLTRAPGEGAGTYAIGQGTLNASSNYRLTFVGSTLTITEEPVVSGVIATSSFASETTDLLDRVDDRTPAAMLQAAALEVVDEREDCEGANANDAGCPSAQPN
jgi:filamentous hemagglutinin family protein